jgi:hypothetical protein
LQLVDVTSAGKPIGRAAASEYGRSVYTVPVDVPAGGVRTVVFQLEGPMDLHGGYHLAVVPQPLANADLLQVDVRTGDGDSVDGGTLPMSELRGTAHVDTRTSGG